MTAAEPPQDAVGGQDHPAPYVPPWLASWDRYRVTAAGLQISSGGSSGVQGSMTTGTVADQPPATLDQSRSNT